ncbi:MULTISPECIES: putative quinol monooxygenase [unclassified Arthrobacter]|uniref:putative quinol monooxygenase n=1 Tax=unclassified Arthrobacter TaxID=235627 RepID=UPI001D13BFB3|nr:MULTISPECIES: antibiotic biosynthesis monooxygenase [unclassified Arthrobacter]MCC3276018.1 antibiotic biosynthesis monooxygenase [Arthrobacter sp. zg-Y20]MCC3277999.1 antibiotic biosynthesis monooxygenase [Arthrobacter sp. zg-Y40]MCC9176397.1 antibiotic biosynthesis monooxygenase [Arthrobacter sp. zg-Y750]MDK1316175.1 antibiotic biosynthesis monooxygenase [Arthrobacter sp. zg.Y20]MDK1326901.1 antibiotic biosynthesis monooxygenase [Arthrobacter sp. zg-Y1143]
MTEANAPINLRATMVPNPGEYNRVKLALEIAIEQVRTEPGCLRYEIVEDSEAAIVLAEQWATQEDLQRHARGAALQDLQESLSALLAEPLKVEQV